MAGALRDVHIYIGEKRRFPFFFLFFSFLSFCNVQIPYKLDKSTEYILTGKAVHKPLAMHELGLKPPQKHHQLAFFFFF